ncbi:hypothetical protein GN958_ATG04335 [Phytophthora infestans]|uniref:Uncharacterized protein n=1 Tax=Phytophthora infestans TaxID=4787 RepID=A0A8S9V0H6_PHYIN|nr:hypothetical protein GN958_ATG04335 [Phytophthora infestans]
MPNKTVIASLRVTFTLLVRKACMPLVTGRRKRLCASLREDLSYTLVHDNAKAEARRERHFHIYVLRRSNRPWNEEENASYLAEMASSSSELQLRVMEILASTENPFFFMRHQVSKDLQAAMCAAKKR